MHRIAVGLLALALSGCSLFHTTKAKTTELANVAKDWCLSIRASQVLCVYPLSEDVQVGDIYLVNTSIENQVKQYQANGFLPFDMLLTRLQPMNYRAMYLDAYATKDQWSNIPHQWQFPATGPTNQWQLAPAAAFPSYTFEVQQGQGLKLAVPIQAVPIGLSLMNSGQAHGSIEIDNASTYGIDQRSIDGQVEGWAACPSTRALLSRYAPRDEANGKTSTHYIRVITRVYLTGKMNVSLQNEEQRAAGVDAGVAQAITMPTTTTGANVAQNYASVLSSLNSAINAPATPVAGAPVVPNVGGSIRVAAVSGRTVSLSQTFDRPIVIGYVAYDRAIGAGGMLGQPRPTFEQMEGQVTPAPLPAQGEGQSESVRFGADANSEAMRVWLKDPANRTQLQAWLTDQSIPTSIPLIVNGSDAAVRQRIVDAFGIGGPCGTTAGH
jgi:hypothetical protein